MSLSEDLRGFAEHMVTLIRDEGGMLPALHLQHPGLETPATLPLDPTLFQDSSRELLVDLVVHVVAGFKPSEVGWTFLAWHHGSGLYDHEAVVVVVVDPEAVEVWQARLVRHDGGASLGAWRKWPIRAAHSGFLIQPVQEALR